MAQIFKFLQDCDPLELVRVKQNEMSLFALVGAREGTSRQGFVSFSMDPPKYLHFMHEGRIDGDFEKYKILSYGKNYKIGPDHSTMFQVGDGTLFKRAGAFVLTETDSYLVVVTHPQQIRYFNLASGTYHGEPGGGRAAFPAWKLLLAGEEHSLIDYKIQ